MRSIVENTNSFQNKNSSSYVYKESSNKEKLNKILKETENINRDTKYFNNQGKKIHNNLNIGKTTFSVLRKEISNTIKMINDMSKIPVFKSNIKKENSSIKKVSFKNIASSSYNKYNGNSNNNKNSKFNTNNKLDILKLSSDKINLDNSFSKHNHSNSLNSRMKESLQANNNKLIHKVNKTSNINPISSLKKKHLNDNYSNISNDNNTLITNLPNKKSSLSRFNYYTISKKDSKNLVLTSRNENSYSLINESTKKGLTPSSIQIMNTITDNSARTSNYKEKQNKLLNNDSKKDIFNNKDQISEKDFSEEEEHISTNNNYLATDNNNSNNNNSNNSNYLKKSSLLSVSRLSKKEKPKRLRTFKIKLIKNYYEKKKLAFKALPKSVITDIDYQSCVFIDELKVLLDNSENLRLHFLTNENMISVFREVSSQNKEEVNFLIEESCGLMMEISFLILKDFSKYIDKFVSVPPPHKDRLKETYVVDEEIAFINNCKLISDIMLFMKGCYEVYLVLIKQEDDIALDYIRYNEVTQFCNRARYNISNLIFLIKAFYKNSIDDKKLLEKFLQDKEIEFSDDEEEASIKKYSNLNRSIFNKKNTFYTSHKLKKSNLTHLPNIVKDGISIKNKSNKINTKGRANNDNFASIDSKISNNTKKSRFSRASRKSSAFFSDYEEKPRSKVKKPKYISLKYKTHNKKLPDRQVLDLGEKIKAQFTYKLNEKVIRAKQLNSLLNRKNDNDDLYEKIRNKTEATQDSCLNSKLINRMMRFIPKNFKEQIISQRIIERFRDKNNYSDED